MSLLPDRCEKSQAGALQLCGIVPGTQTMSNIMWGLRWEHNYKIFRLRYIKVLDDVQEPMSSS